MTRATFFKHFDLLADQPDAVAKMRELVLQLAVRGLLVERDKRDETTTKLLERVRVEKQKFLAANKLKDPEALPEIDADEAPFNCPAGWQWVRLGTISNRINYGYTASADHLLKDVRLLRITDIQDNQVNWDTVPGCQISAEDVAKYELHENDILIARTGGTIGKTFLVSNVTVKAVFASYLIRLIPSSQVCAAYLKLFLESGPYWQQLRAKSVGTGQPNVNGEALSGLCVSLPPLAEQRRIVAKVDELMALCDELGTRQQARQVARAQLQQSALHHLLAARDPHTFAPAWQRVRDQFHLLHDSPDAIPHLRQAILQLAVQGRLVPQNPKDEPVSELLATVRQQKERRVALGRIQNERQAKARNAKQALFAIPETWQWVRLSDLTELITKGSSPKWQGISYVGKDEGVLFITSENVGTYELRKLDDLKYVEKRFNEIEPRSMLKFGDILMNLVGASIGRTAVYNLQVDANINQAVALIRLMPGITDEFSAFLLHYLNSPSAVEHMLSSQVVNAQPNISLTDARDFPVPIPPLAEQKRIVARVEALLRQCDALAAQLHQARSLGAHLLDSTLHHLLAA